MADNTDGGETGKILVPSYPLYSRSQNVYK